MTAGVPLSTFALSDLALQSALELDRARLGAAFDPQRLLELANALSSTAAPEPDGAPFRFVEPGYYEPFERLYHRDRPDQGESIEAIQAFFGEVAEKLRHLPEDEARADSIDRLKAFCMGLHRELIRELSAEPPFVRQDWTRADVAAAPGLG